MTETGQVIRTGIIGCGKIAHETYMPVLSAMSVFRVVAAADTDMSRCRSLADQFRIPARYASHHELLEGAELDAVIVVTTPVSHAEIGLDVLEAGKTMFLDKPMAMSREECDSLVQKGKSLKSTVLIGFTSRWHRLVTQAREVVRSGILGPLKAVRSIYTHAHNGPSAQPWHRKLDQGGGVVFNDGGHHFDLWRYLLDTEVVSVKADCFDSQDFEDDTCTISARLGTGTLASAVFSFSTRASSEIEIFGEQGSLLLNLYRFDGLWFSGRDDLPGSIGVRVKRFTHFLRSLPAGIAAISRGGEFDACYAAMWRHLGDCVLNGAQPLCGLEDGRAAVSVSLAAQESVSTGRAVKP